MFKFKNTYSTLPERFHQHVSPEAFKNPKLLIFNKKLAKRLALNYESLDEGMIAKILTGELILDSSVPIAMAYAGHQFGNFSPSLGDGRAALLGEVQIDHELFDIHLKGSGRTYYSRRGDGRCGLGPAIREYLVSLFMKNINIPTTESLSVCLTGEEIYRETISPGATVARVAKGHVRIGTFEYFFYKKDFEAIKILADYSINRFYPKIQNDNDPYISFFKAVSKRQSHLVAKWMATGFIHGVLNTDNTSITGETIDFGPCAFMDSFKQDKVFSSIDIYKRYAYNNQAKIIMWNLSSLANCLISLYPENRNEAIKLFEKELAKLDEQFHLDWLSNMSQKFGIKSPHKEDEVLINEFLSYLEENNLDFTISFRELPDKINSDINVYKKIKARILDQDITLQEAIALMNKTNPSFIARNHHIEEAITKSLTGDYSYIHLLAAAYENPFSDESKYTSLKEAPSTTQIVSKTFCGT